MSGTHKDLSFDVLSLLSQERGVYGLRNGDYERYRHHCSNKIHRLRQVSNLSIGKGKQSKKPADVAIDNVKDVKQLQLLVFSAERALAHSHGLKALASKPKHPKMSKRDQISWLRKALKYSTSLHSIASSFASDPEARVNQRTLAEITIYHLSIRSEVSFERGQWAESLTDSAARRKLLTTILDSAKNSYDQALANEFIDAYDPLIRYCAYKLGRPESHDIEGVVKDVDDEMMEETLPGYAKLVEGLRSEVGAEDLEKGRKELEDVTFAGEKVELRSAELVNVMLKVQEAFKRLQKKKDGGKGRGMKGWDSIMGVLGEAEGVAKKLLDDHEASASSTSLRSNKTLENLSFTHQYIVYLLLSHRIKRDLLLIETLQTSSGALPTDPTSFKIPGGRVKVEEAIKNLTAIVKLYDTVLQSFSQIRSLAIVEEKEGVRVMAEGLEAYYHATKCYQLARLHCIHPTPSYASAVQLIARASTSIRQAKSSLFELHIPLQESVIELQSSDIDKPQSQVDQLDLAAKQALFAERVPKPVFFDTAFNYIDLPFDELQVLAGKKKEEPKAPGVVEKVKTAAVRTTRESTPAVVEAMTGQQGSDVGGTDEKPKGWLGGWFGRK